LHTFFIARDSWARSRAGSFKEDNMKIEKLIDVINNFNNATCDRKRANNALVLVLYDDESGFLGTTRGTKKDFQLGNSNLFTIVMNNQLEFYDMKELIEFLKSWKEVT
jgi:hypothetical protein